MATLSASLPFELPPHVRYAPSSNSISPEETLTSRWHQSRRKLLELRRMKSNWDGLGADAPDPAVVDAAIGFLSSLKDRPATPPPDRIVIAPDGAVILEWQSGMERVQAEICDLDQVEWMHSRSSGKALHWNESLHDETLGEHDWDQRPESVAGGAASVYAY